MDDKNTIARQVSGDPLIRHGAEVGRSFIDEATNVPLPTSCREIPARLDNQRSQARDIKDRLYALAERLGVDIPMQCEAVDAPRKSVIGDLRLLDEDLSAIAIVLHAIEQVA